MAIPDDKRRVSISLDADLLAWLEGLASDRDRTISYVLERIASQYRRRLENDRARRQKGKASGRKGKPKTHHEQKE